MTTTSSKPGPVKTFDDLFGGSGTNGASAKDSVVFNKDSDDESESGGRDRGQRGGAYQGQRR